jgi:cytidylate kinase
MTRKLHIAIDGPAGAGKSTIAKRLSADLGIVYVDTGALYRTVGLCALRRGIDPKDREKVPAMLPDIRVELAFQNGAQHVLLNGEDVSEQIRTQEVSMAASDVSAIPAVRQFLFDTQREIAARQSIVMDGRDIGTVVLPDAQVKIFLTASPEDRAKRRYDELVMKGEICTFNEVLAQVKERDAQDSGRAVAPLKPAEDAVLVDTSGETLEESVARIRNIVEKEMGGASR